jgi:AraC-like DNA-binding protein
MTSAAAIDPPTRLTLRVGPGSAADFEVWRWALSPMWDADVLAPRSRADFSMQACSSIFGGLSVGRARMSAAARYRRGRREIARSSGDQIMVIVYDGAGPELRTGRHELMGRSGDITLLDLSRPAEFAVGASACMTCMLPRTMLESLLPTLDDLHGMVLPEGSGFNALLRPQIHFLEAHAAEFSESQRQNVVQGLAHLVAAAADPSYEARPAADRAVFAVRFRQVREMIDAHLADRALGPEFLARHFHLSRASLYRMFEPAGGVAAYILRRRLMRAHRDLTDPVLFGLRINEIADRWGFTGHAVFSRAYRNHYGMQPSEARANAGANTPRDPGDESFGVLNRWLLGCRA